MGLAKVQTNQNHTNHGLAVPTFEFTLAVLKSYHLENEKLIEVKYM